MTDKKFVFISLKNERDTYLNGWMQKQKAKGLRSAVTSKPSDDAKQRLRHGLAGCLLLDCRGRLVELDDSKLVNLAERSQYVRDLFTSFETRPDTLTRAFKIAYQTAFGSNLSAANDPYLLIENSETATHLLYRCMGASLSEKIAMVERKIDMIEATKFLLADYAEKDDALADGSNWYQQTAKLHYEACVKFLNIPKAPTIARSTELGVSSEMTVDRAKNCFAAEIRAAGLAKMAFEREIVFDNARVVFKASGTAGGLVSASAKGRLATAESATNEVAAGDQPTLAAGEISVVASFGVTLKASAELESEFLDASVSAEAFGGAVAKCKVAGYVKATGAGASLEAEAFIGARASITGTSKLKLFGMPILTETVTASVSAGLGASAKLAFDVDLFEGASGSIKLETTVGVGGGVSSTTKINHYNLVLAAGESAQELTSLIHNAQARAQGYRKFGQGEKMTNALKTRLTSDLDSKKALYEAEYDRLMAKKAASGGGG